jgi:hypothetical protein
VTPKEVRRREAEHDMVAVAAFASLGDGAQEVQH